MRLTRPFSVVIVCVLSALSLGGCFADASPESAESEGSYQEALTTAEGFESGSKTAYAAGNVTLSSGSWNMSGTLPPT